MSDILINILEKFKKVDGGPLDPKRSGADGAEDDFIGKHTDNIEVTDAPVVGGGESHSPKNPDKMAPRKKHRKGYEPGEDADVYESTDFMYVDEIAEAMDLSEETEMYFNLIEEAIQEFIEEEASDEEKEVLEAWLQTEEGYSEFIQFIFEEDDDDDEDEEDDDDEDEEETSGKKGVIEKDPKLKKEVQTEEIERRADVKMVKVKTPDGKVVYRKQRPEIKIGD